MSVGHPTVSQAPPRLQVYEGPCFSHSEGCRSVGRRASQCGPGPGSGVAECTVVKAAILFIDMLGWSMRC
jgi:hypothetical protein